MRLVQVLSATLIAGNCWLGYVGSRSFVLSSLWYDRNINVIVPCWTVSVIVMYAMILIVLSVMM